MKTKKINIYLIFNLLLFLFSIAIIGWGLSTEQKFLSAFLIALGGTFLGTGLSGIISFFRNKDFYDSVLDVLKKNQNVGLKSEEEFIEKFRTKWHKYYVTINEDGEKFWNYYEFDFTNSITPGTLMTEVQIGSSTEKKLPYILEGIRKESNSPLIIFSRGKDSEEKESVMIYPFVGKKYRDIFFGYQFLEAWNGKEVLCPSVISVNKIGNGNSNVVDEKTVAELEKLWNRFTKNKMEVLINNSR